MLREQAPRKAAQGRSSGTPGRERERRRRPSAVHADPFTPACPRCALASTNPGRIRMKLPLIAATLTTLALAASPALADKGKGHDKHHDRAHAVHSDKADHGRHDNGRHLGWQKQAWKRGDRIPLADLGPGYYVDDYRAYNLAPPPRGYRWVRPMDDRYLLVQVATGLIDEVLGY
jgi:Ni/Co efflux regulator RcnB